MRQATSSTRSPNGGQVPVRDINGRKLSRALHKGEVPPDWRARLALRLEDGSAWPHHLPPKMARDVTGATRRDVAAQRGAERQANGNGNKRVLFRNNPTDADVDTIVAQVGAERLMGAL